MRLTLTIYGNVQGVMFRSSTRQMARTLDLGGYVKNCPDGTVEIVAEGEKSNLEKLRNWCTRGPDYAEVMKVEEKWEDINKSHFPEFSIKLF